MKRKIVIATMNDHKVSEIRALIGDRYNVMTQSSFSIPSVSETGKTFEENALIKANAVSKKTGLLTLADDSSGIYEQLSCEGFREITPDQIQYDNYNLI